MILKNLSLTFLYGLLVQTTIYANFSQKNYITNKNVLDYYLEIPKEILLCDNYSDKDSKDYRVSRILRMDIRNGYVLSYHGGLIYVQVALFKNPLTSKDIIGVVASCGMGCMCNENNFYEIQSNGTWNNVTDKIIPKEYMDAGWFMLPEVGTTIQIYDYDILDHYEFKTMTELQKKALKHELIWDKGKFISKK